MSGNVSLDNMERAASYNPVSRRALGKEAIPTPPPASLEVGLLTILRRPERIVKVQCSLLFLLVVQDERWRRYKEELRCHRENQARIREQADRIKKARERMNNPIDGKREKDEEAQSQSARKQVCATRDFPLGFIEMMRLMENPAGQDILR